MDRPKTGGIYKTIDGVLKRVDEDGFPIRLDAAGNPVIGSDGAFEREPVPPGSLAPSKPAARAAAEKPAAGKPEPKDA